MKDDKLKIDPMNLIHDFFVWYKKFPKDVTSKLKRIPIPILSLFAVYFLGSIFAWSLNPLDWWKIGRVILGITCLIVGVSVFFHARKL